MKIIRSKFYLCLICFILAISSINICFAGSNQLPELKVYDPSQSYRMYMEAQKQREERRRIELENQRLQQEIQERELQRQNRMLEERRQQRLLEERRQADMKKQTEQGNDIYAELIKLDELKQKGIITEKEFEIQKKKILSRDNTYAGMGKPNTQKSCEAQCAEMFNNGELRKGMDAYDCIDALCGNQN